MSNSKPMPSTRQLAAIMFTDIVGYTALMGRDEEKALEILRKNRQIHKSAIDQYQGQWLKEIGDAVLAQFNSAVHAVQCAHEIQRQAQGLGASIRIGIHLGDVAFENSDVFGDGVNIASRIQSIADPGGIYVTESVHNAIRAQAHITTRYLGEVRLKNVAYPIGVYCLVDLFLPVPSPAKIKDLTRDQTKSKKWVWYVIAFMLITLIGSVWWYRSEHVIRIRSLVVLPVENRTGNPEISLYAEGIHDAIINEIGKITGLRVPSIRTSLKYRESNLSIPEIARELNVEGVIEPSLFTMGDSVEIRIDLIAAEPEEHRLWSQVFKRDMTHVLSLYADVATSIAKELDIPLTNEQLIRFATQREVIPKAYEAYIKGMSHWYKLTKSDLDQALRYFELAIEIDPNYAPAYAGVAMVWGGRLQQGLVPNKDIATTLDSLTDIAVALDSTLIEVHYTVALANTWWHWNWDRAGKAFRKTIELDPDHAGARIYYSHYLNIIGRSQQAMEEADKALALDPVNPLFRALYAMDLNYARRFNEAIALLNKTLQEAPNDPVALSTLRAAYHNNKQFDKAYDVYVRSYEVRNDSLSVKALKSGYSKGGYKQALISLADFLVKRSSERYVAPFQIGTLYTRAGKKDDAILYLNKAYQDHDANMPYIGIDPIFDDLKKDSRFRALIERMEFPAL